MEKLRVFILGFIGGTKGGGAAARPRPLQGSGEEGAELGNSRFSPSPTASKAGQRGCSSHWSSVLLFPPRPLFPKGLVCALAASIPRRVPALHPSSIHPLQSFVQRDIIIPAAH